MLYIFYDILENDYNTNTAKIQAQICILFYRREAFSKTKTFKRFKK